MRRRRTRTRRWLDVALVRRSTKHESAFLRPRHPCRVIRRHRAVRTRLGEPLLQRVDMREVVCLAASLDVAAERAAKVGPIAQRLRWGDGQPGTLA